MDGVGRSPDRADAGVAAAVVVGAGVAARDPEGSVTNKLPPMTFSRSRREIRSKVRPTAGRDFVAVAEVQAGRAGLHPWRVVLAVGVDEARVDTVRRIICSPDRLMAGRALVVGVAAGGAKAGTVRKAIYRKLPLMAGRDFVEVAGDRTDRARLHPCLVAAGADSEGTVLKTGIFRATLEDAVDEAGSVVLQPARRRRHRVAAQGSRAAAACAVGLARRATTNQLHLTVVRATPTGVVAGVASTGMVRRVAGSKGRPMVDQDFVEVAGGRADRADLHRW
jgi:hypothetical protein